MKIKSDLDLSADQTKALETLIDWWKDPNRKQLITLGGYAGCGKTTIVTIFRNMLAEETPDLHVAFCAFTGKAASVMSNKLKKNVSNDIIKDDKIGTIHSLIYEPVFDGENIVDWRRVYSLNSVQLIIIDEASMVSRKMYEDLKSFNLPMIAVGDHGQLPPIDSTGFNLMDDPQIKLETLHRFAENDGLIKVSMMARVDGYVKFGEYNNQVFRVTPKDPLVKEFIKQRCGKFDDSVLLCGFNKTRIDMNRKIRKSLGAIDDDLTIGDKVVCLKNNPRAMGCGIYNGMIGEVIKKVTYPNAYDVSVRFNESKYPYKGAISKSSFCNEKPDCSEFMIYRDLRMLRKVKGMGDYFQIGDVVKDINQKIYLDNFDYGYAITVHKSQGSEWGNVVVLEEKSKYWASGDMWCRWYYTAVTRARDKLLLVGLK